MEIGETYKHKYLGIIEITEIRADLFYAKTENRGIMPFLFNDLGKVIFPVKKTKALSSSIEAQKESVELTVNYDPSLYGKHRKTAFPYNGTTESERRHSMNSKRKLRNSK